MSDDYTFFHMLKDILFNGNKVSGKKDEDIEDGHEPWGGFSSGSSSSHKSGEFDPSDSAGEAFRSVFGDDNRE